MKFLVDTCAFAGANELSPLARRILEDDDNDIFLSSVSAYEIVLKAARGQWPEMSVVAADVGATVRRFGYTELPATIAHCELAGRLPQIHRDPFDRIIAAQSILGGLPLLTVDRRIADFGVAVVW